MSCDGRFVLIMQDDGNVVLYQGHEPLWHTHGIVCTRRAGGKLGSRVHPDHQDSSERATLDDGPKRGPAAASLERGDAVGRYLVLERIGAGGMGVVYAAYDPQLDRKVAVKLLHPRRPGEGDIEDRQRRLLREAQALAKLSHPNVVAVYDAGIHERAGEASAVFVAMEFVDGQTVARWLTHARPSWRTVLEVFTAAGRGLAAAHAVGLVHRDMKPDNIMLGVDPHGAHEVGRVRVMDFGLARGGSGRPDESHAEGTPHSPHSELLNAELTHGGRTLGTPAYMAPEQYLGVSVDARTDQFSFCVALWEALYGERPFAATGIADLMMAVTEGRIREPPAARGIAGWLRRVVERGLASDPAQRWPDMPALLDALARDPTRSRHRWLAFAALAGIAGLVFALRAVARAGTREDCVAAGETIAEVWGEQPRTRLHAALAGEQSALAEATWSRVQPWLDDYAAQWQQKRTEICIAAELDGTLAPQLRERGDACLDERRLALGELVAVLDDANIEVLRQAVFASAGLPPLASCSDEQWLARRLYGSGDEAMRVAVAEVRGRLAQASALVQTGRTAAALELAQAARVDAETVGWPPLVAEADVRLGMAASAAGNYAEAERALNAAYLAAGESGAEDVAAEAATMLVQIVGAHLARREAGLMWADQARMMLQRVDEADDGLRSARLDRALGSLHRAHDDFDEAQAHYGRALEVLERTLGPDHPDVAMTIAQLASVADNRGDHDEALAQYEEALARLERVLGPDHPQVALIHDSVGGILYARGDHADALARRERGLAILTRALGPDHPEVAKSLDNLGNVHAALGHGAQSAEHHQRALAIFERALGPDHPDVARSLGNLAAVLVEDGRYEEALPHATRALDLFQHAFGNDHRDVAIAFMTLGDLHHKRGALAEAEAAYRQALEVFQRVAGDRHPDLGQIELAIAEVVLASGRPADALAPFTRALSLRGQDPDDPVLPQVRFGLALALWESDGDRERALEFAREAAAGYRKLGPERAADLERVEAWLGTHTLAN